MFKAKFVVEIVEQGTDYEHIHAYPVMTGSEENKSFAKWTPGGSLDLFISEGTTAKGQLVKGQEFYMDITPID